MKEVQMTKAATRLLAAVFVLASSSAFAKQGTYGPYCYGDLCGPTTRQIANTLAYERGGDYYETPSSAHVFGSRSWWRMKETRAP